MRAFFAAYAALSYLLFAGSFLYTMGFLANRWVPKTVDSGEPGALLPALIVDALVLGAFAIQHSVMARPAFKRWWTRWVPEQIERSTYVLASTLLLILILVAWRPLPVTVWHVESAAGSTVLVALYWIGWITVFASTFMISHFELFGLKQAIARRAGIDADDRRLVTRYLYRYVRHPIMLGFLVAFWATPHMTVGHLLWAVLTTGYIFVGVALEERDMVARFGAAYRSYQRRVPRFLPLRAPIPRDGMDAASARGPEPLA